MKHIKGSRLHLALLVVCVLLAVQCGTDRTVYYLSSTGSDPLAVNWKDSLENVKIYFETSPSMKGYVNLPSVSDSGYIIKRVVPYLITDCQNFPGSVELYTIVISPKRYTQGVDAFNRNLRNGSHMMRSNSELHKIFQVLIENTGPGEISFLITDNIPDLKDGGKNVSLDEITTLIDKVLNENPDISAAVFQFYSEFNGDHYYDQSGSGRPFLNKHITLHHRPLYIWMLGRQELIQMALGEGLFREPMRYPVANSYLYGTSMHAAVPFQLFDYFMESGAGFPDPEDSCIYVTEVTPVSPISVFVGLDLSKLPLYAQHTDYILQNIAFGKESLNLDNSIEVFDRNSVRNLPFYHNVVAPDAYENMSHFLKITMGNLDIHNDQEFSIVLKDLSPDWIRSTHLPSDSGVNHRDLEYKTFAFRYFTDGFSQRFRNIGDNNLFELTFTQ